MGNSVRRRSSGRLILRLALQQVLQINRHQHRSWCDFRVTEVSALTNQVLKYVPTMYCAYVNTRHQDLF
jgi:hypothetical protein